ncbi:LAQU0S12e02498g1_1 [Lachancea quebecensis]|uniref:LAQU0S12e02498g1_1 n=1 Tax=Lachancea quebecensis TaxID=1654605 RepID=A0A0P1KUQ5_9SACH|nr:LAQU0S12e02498g1_1 [Lachancea quebecensis]
MLYQGIEDHSAFDNRMLMMPKRGDAGGSGGGGGGGATAVAAASAQPGDARRGHSGARSGAFGTPGNALDAAPDAELDPLVNLYYPMATANPPPAHNDISYGSSMLPFSAASPSSLYDMDFYTSNYSGRSEASRLADERRAGSVAGMQGPAGQRDSFLSYTMPPELCQARTQQVAEQGLLYTASPLYGASATAFGSLNGSAWTGPLDTSLDHDVRRSSLMKSGVPMPNVNTDLKSNSDFVPNPNQHNTNNNNYGYEDAEEDGNDEAEEDADNSDSDHQSHLQRQRRFSSSRTPSSGTIATSFSQGSRKVSDSRLSAQGLAEVLNLESAEEALRRERFILDIFERELQYPLGYKTWVRDTSKEYRTQLLDQLHRRVSQTYPEYDKPVLETIIRRATYYMMQSRLRRERRAKAKVKRDEERRSRGSRGSESGHSSHFELPHYGGPVDPGFLQ